MLRLNSVSRWLRFRQVILLLLLVLAIGSFLRIYDLGTESIWLDEASSIGLSTQGVTLIIEGAGSTQAHPPLYFIILHFWMNIFGTGEAAIRSLSAIFGILSILLIYQVGSSLFNRKVGLISSFLSAISYYHIYYSQEARSYALLLLLSLVSYLLFIKILKQDRGWHYPCYFLASLLLGYTHIFGLFIIASQIFYFLLFWNEYKRQRIRLLIAQASTLVGLSPLVLIIGQTTMAIAQGGFWISEPSLLSIFSTLAEYAGQGAGQNLLLLVLLFLALVGFFSIKRMGGKWIWRRPLASLQGASWSIRFESIKEVLLLIIWLSFPIVIPFIISKVTTPIYVTRYTIGASPALYLLVAKGINTFTKKKVLYPILIVALLSIPGLQSYYANDVKEQWRETADLVELNSMRHDVIVFCAPYCQSPFDYYYKGDLPRFGIRKDVEGTQEIATFVDHAVQGKDRLWLILSHGGKNAPIRDYLVHRYKSRRIILEKESLHISVILFDLLAP